MEGFSKKETGLMDMDNSVVIARERGIRGLNSNEKKYNIFLNKRRQWED